MTLHRASLAGIVIALAAGYTAHAASIQGTQNLAASVDSPFGDVKTQASFSLDPLLVFGAATGDFSGYPTPDSLGTVTLSRASLSSFAFGNAAFGTFTANAGAEIAAPENLAIFLFDGAFAPGTFFAGLDAAPAQVLVVLTQGGGPGAAIGFAGALRTDALGIIPEPPSGALAGIGLVSFSIVLAVRRCIRK